MYNSKLEPHVQLQLNHEGRFDTIDLGDVELAKKLLCEQSITSEDGTSATQYFIFAGDTSDDEIRLILPMFSVDLDETHCQHAYDCCGHWYHSKLHIEPYVEGSKFRIAWQSSYMNV